MRFAILTGMDRILAFLVFLCMSGPVWANEPLNFGAADAALRAALPHDSITVETHMFAQADLNDDGVPEYIAREKECADLCGYHVLGRVDTGLVPLGDMRARNVTLDQGATHGVRNLAVFSDPLNDYRAALYRWNPEASAYRVEGEE